MRFAAKARPGRFAQFAERIFGLEANAANELDCALEGINRFEAFLKSIGCPTRLFELGIDDALFVQYAKDAALVVLDDDGNLLGRPPMRQDDIVAVLRSAL